MDLVRLAGTVSGVDGLTSETLAEELRERLRTIDERLAEVEPLRVERARIEAALRALEPPVPAKPAVRRPARKPRATRAAPGRTREMVLAYLGEHPGSSAAAIAAAIDAKRPSVSTLLSRLAKDGTIERADGTGYRMPQASAPAPDPGGEPADDPTPES